MITTTVNRQKGVPVETREPLFERVIGPLTRTDFVRFAGAGGDFNPIHHDEVYAVSHGHPSVFAMGMLTASLAASCLSEVYDLAAVQSFGVRFLAPVWPGDVLRFSGYRAEAADKDAILQIDFVAVDENGVGKLSGYSAVRVPDSEVHS